MDTGICPTSEILAAFALGNLSVPELDFIARHLDECPTCEKEFSRLEVADDRVLAELRRACELMSPQQPTDHHAHGDIEQVACAEPDEDWGEFHIGRKLGSGGMGIVYEAYQGSLRRHVAVKFLPRDGDLPRFRREARAAGRLHHTNLVPVFGVGEHRGQPYYVMQYIPGRGLNAVLLDRPGRRLEPREAARISLLAAEALD